MFPRAVGKLSVWLASERASEGREEEGRESQTHPSARQKRKLALLDSFIVYFQPLNREAK